MDAPPSVDTCSHVPDTKRKPRVTTVPQKKVSFFPSCTAPVQSAPLYYTDEPCKGPSCLVSSNLRNLYNIQYSLSSDPRTLPFFPW